MLNAVQQYRREGWIEPILNRDLSAFDKHVNRSTAALRFVWSGVLMPPRAGRYRLLLEIDGADALSLKVFAKPSQRTVLDIKAGTRVKPEAEITLPDRPVAVELTYLIVGSAPGRIPARSIVWKWQPPGAREFVPIPPEALFHSREQERLVTER